MSANARSRERREVMATARRYRRDGYKVTGPDDWQDRPSFLGDIVPDLIAERDNDKVVIEIKQAAAVRGSNEIVEIAKRVSEQPGWRFELIGLPTEAVQIEPPALDRSYEEVERLLDQGFLKPAFVMACAIIENLAAYAAVLLRRKAENQTLRELVRELVVHGVADEDAKHVIEKAQASRNAIAHGAGAPAPTRDEVEALLKIGRDIQRHLLAPGEA